MFQQNFCHRIKLLTIRTLLSITCLILCTASLFVDMQPLNGLIFKNETLPWVHRLFSNQCFLKKMVLRWTIALRFLCQNFNSRSLGLLTCPWFFFFFTTFIPISSSLIFILGGINCLDVFNKGIKGILIRQLKWSATQLQPMAVVKFPANLCGMKLDTYERAHMKNTSP